MHNFFTHAKVSFEKFRDYVRRWTAHYARKPAAVLWLALFSFAEASFFPIAPDVLLIAILLVRTRWIYYSFITTLASTFGGLLGYAIGILFFKAIGVPIISFYGLEEEMSAVGTLFQQNAFWAIFTAAFTPIPYKVFTIAGGFFSVNIWIFLIASVVGRGLRFFIIGYIVFLYGEKIKYIIIKYFNILSLLIIPVIIAYIFSLKFFN